MPKIEVRVLRFLMQYQELGYLPINNDTINGFTKMVKETVGDELASAKKKESRSGVHNKD